MMGWKRTVLISDLGYSATYLGVLCGFHNNDSRQQSALSISPAIWCVELINSAVCGVRCELHHDFLVIGYTIWGLCTRCVGCEASGDDYL